MATLTRTIEIDGITPKELATVFAGYFAEDQAAFFDELYQIARGWPGAGWCQQSCAIVPHMTTDARSAIVTIASHLPAGDVAQIVAGSADA